MFEDNIGIRLQIDKDEDTGYLFLVCHVSINGTEVNQFCEFTEFLLTSEDNRCYHTKRWYPTHKQLDYSSFQPFTCSCGISGCVGIYDGIYSKHRKHSVEWRIPRNCGYDKILDKTFYSFSKRSYQSQVDNLWKFIEDNKDVLLYDEEYDGYYDDNEEWIEEVNYIKLGDKYKWLHEN